MAEWEGGASLVSELARRVVLKVTSMHGMLDRSAFVVMRQVRGSLRRLQNHVRVGREGDLQYIVKLK